MKKKLISTAITVSLIFLLSLPFIKSSPDVYLPILMYHDVSPSGTEPGPYSVSEEKFRSDMEYLHENGYKTITADALIAYKALGARPDDKTVMITFDDGYATNYTTAYPILKELQLKATIAVIGYNIESGNFASFMTPDQARELQQSGVIDIQSHTYDLHHGEDITDTPPYGRGIYRNSNETKADYQKRLRNDLEKSQQFLESIGSELKLIAFPYGICDPWAKEVLDSMNVRVTLLTGDKLHKYTGSNYNLLRLSVHEHTDLSKILP